MNFSWRKLNTEVFLVIGPSFVDDILHLLFFIILFKFSK